MKDTIVAAALILAITLSLPPVCPGTAEAGGYSLTDREGKAISEDGQHEITIGPSDRRIVLTDRADRKVFDLIWDADEHSLVIRGDRAHVKVHRDGTIEKWTALPEGQTQPPILIEPIVPYGVPRK